MAPRTVIVVTASNAAQAAAVEAELAARLQGGAYAHVGGGGGGVRLFVVPDPSDARVGSGGATLNALLTVSELLGRDDDDGDDSSAAAASAATASAATPNLSRLAASRVFMIHSGGDSQRLPSQSVTGKAWSQLPVAATPGGVGGDLAAPIDLLLARLFELFADVASGLVVASSDVLLYLPPVPPPEWPSTGAAGLAIPCTAALGPNHGVYQVDGWASAPPPPPPYTRAVAYNVARFWQKASVVEMADGGAVRRFDDTVLLDTGVLYFAPPAVAHLVELARTHPLERCTYLGVDSAHPPLRLELYSDVMMALGGGAGLTRAQYDATPTADASASSVAAARELLWRSLAHHPFSVVVVEGGGFTHVGTTAEYLALLTAPTPAQARFGLARTAAWYHAGGAVVDEWSCAPPPGSSGSCLQNTYALSAGAVGPGAVVEHSVLSGSWALGACALVSSVRTLPDLVVRPGMAVQELRVHGGQRVVSVMAVGDGVKDAASAPTAGVCGVPWRVLLDTAGVTPEEIWAGVAPDKRSLWNAALFAASPPPPVPDLLPAAPAPAPDAAASALADRVALWLQYLPTAPAAARPHDAPPLDAHTTALAAAHLAPEVLAAWRAARRYSLRDLLEHGDAGGEFAWRRRLRGAIDASLLVAAVGQTSNVCVTPLVARLGGAARSVVAAVGGAGSVLDDVVAARLPGDPAAPLAAALRGLDALAARATPDVAGAALALESALLWEAAGWGSVEARTGPAHHPEWRAALALLEGHPTVGTAPDGAGVAGRRAAAVAALAAVRDRWLVRTHTAGRAARHYERAAQLVTAQCVYTAPTALPTRVPLPSRGGWAAASAPARLDLAGGWSDTPPITYEARVDGAIVGADVPYTRTGDAAADAVLAAIADRAAGGGGLVVNAAVTVDGCQPLGCRARLLPPPASGAPALIIRTRAAAASGGTSTGGDDEEGGGRVGAARAADGAPGVIVSSLAVTRALELADYNQPHAEGAIVKCALLFLRIASLHPAAPPLAQQLAHAAHAAEGSPQPVVMEVETWSLLPHGSGLGASSILAGAVLAAVARAVGWQLTPATLTHGVLIVEQMLSTGGGWQDQVGGLEPGVKACFCPAALPLTVASLPLVPAAGGGAPATLAAFLDAHLVLVYTGRTRLAKNLLQRVLRQWAARENGVTRRVAALRTNAVSMAAALAARDAVAVGAALSTYWEQKKGMAPRAEPPEVTAMIAALARAGVSAGATLAGAGGGGFLVVVTTAPHAAAAVASALAADATTAHLRCSTHAVAVDAAGLRITVD